MAIWNISDVVRVSLPPEEAEGSGGGAAEKPEIDEEYIEPPEQPDSQEQDSSDGGSSSQEDSDANDSGSGPEESDSKEDSDPQQGSEEDAEEGSGEESDGGVGDGQDPDTDSEPSSGEEEDSEEVQEPGTEEGAGEPSPVDPQEDAGGVDDENSSAGGEESSEGDEEGTDGDESSGEPSKSSEDGDETSGEEGETSADGEETAEGGEEGSDPEEEGSDGGDFEENEVPQHSAEEQEEMRKALDRLRKELTSQAVLQGLQEVSADVQEVLDTVSKGQRLEYKVAPGVKDRLYRVDGGAQAAAAKLQQGIQDIGNLAVKLRRLFADNRSRVVHTGLKRGKRLSGKDVHRIHTDRAQGKVPRIWKREEEGVNLDSAVSIAVDNSGSMQGDSAYMVERLTMALGTTLQRMRVPFEMMGYTAVDADGCAHGTKGVRDYPVDINVIKTFEERQFDVRRCIFPSECGITPDLDCLRIMSPRLLARPEPKKILFVLTDGEPTACGHELTVALMCSLKEHIQEMRRRGVVVFGFGIQADLHQYYGDDFVFVDANNMKDFPNLVIGKLTKLLLG